MNQLSTKNYGRPERKTGGGNEVCAGPTWPELLFFALLAPTACPLVSNTFETLAAAENMIAEVKRFAARFERRLLLKDETVSHFSAALQKPVSATGQMRRVGPIKLN